MIRKSLFALRTISEVDAAFGAVYDDDDDEDDGILFPKPESTFCKINIRRII